MAQFEVITQVLAAAVSLGGVIDVPYPDGKTADDYVIGGEHWMHTQSKNPIFAQPGHFQIEYAAASLKLTIASNVAFEAGETVYLNMQVGEGNVARAAKNKVSVLSAVRMNLGAPLASDGDAAVQSQSATVLNGLATGINGAMASEGIAYFDVPRNVVAAWTGAAVLTVIGTDEYGNKMIEQSASGTSFTGKKAFKTVNEITVDSDVTGLTVGMSKVLGLPIVLGDTDDLLTELEDGDAAGTAGTLSTADTNIATATTGDVRGTYEPSGSLDGSRSFVLVAHVRSPEGVGVPQFRG